MAAKNDKYPFPPFGRFEAFLDDLQAMEVRPNRLNPSVFGTNYSGSGIRQIIQAFEFFGLTNEDGSFNEDRLKPLADPKSRKQALNALLKERYGGLIALPLASATPAEVNSWFGNLGMDAQTARKAKSFFLQAAQASGIPMHSKVLERGRRGAGSGIRRKRRKRGAVDEPEDQTQLNTPPVVTGSQKAITFRSGGTATLTVSVDIVQLSRDDREELFKWLDAMSAYEEGTRKRESRKPGAAESRRVSDVALETNGARSSAHAVQDRPAPASDGSTPEG